MRKVKFIAFFYTFSLIYAGGIGVHICEASHNVLIKGIRYWSNERYTRVVVDADGPLKFTKNRLSDPDRLYFDIKNSRLQGKTDPSLHIEDGILKKIRTGQFKNDTVRVVLDLHALRSFNAFVLKEPYRLVIDVFNGKTTDTKRKEKEQKGFSGIKRVIIDPGHGGTDPGAIGPGGLREKDVVLSVAKNLGRILIEKYDMEVTYTREKDVFIPLEERTAIANSKKGDLFLSIHTNASRKRKTRGIETYFLNWTNNKESMRVAARENKISVVKMERAQDELQKILKDLERENKKEESMALARSVQDALVEGLSKDYSRIVDLGVKYALFYVLVGAGMPSVLVEISFISNREEEYRLKQMKYREKIAEYIASGVRQYSVPSTLVKRGNDDF
jgi:N-acetylmuramoyl-L-alanine amidase